jgi:hypothetical protein
VTLLVALASRGTRWAIPALVIVTAADIALWGTRDVFRTPPQTIASLTAGVPGPTSEPGGEYLFANHEAYAGNLLVMRGYRLASGYLGLPPLTYFHYASPIARQLSGAHWDFGPDGKARYEHVVDRARMLADARFTPNHGFGFDWTKVDLHTTALVDVDLPPLAGPPGTARVIDDRPGAIAVDVTAPGTQLVALTERYHPGWRATANGAPLQTVAIHGDFLGCLVTGGSMRVEFRFEPASYTRGRWLAIAGLIALAVITMTLTRGRDVV